MFINEDIIKELMKKEILTLVEVKGILDYIARDIKTSLNIDSSETRLCKKSCMKMWDLCDKLDVPYIMFNIEDIGMTGFEHYYGIAGFRTEFGQICFLIDLTYIQFTDNLYSVKVNGESRTKYVSSPGSFMSDENKFNLVNKGYITITEDNFNDYIRGFIESYKLVNPLNEFQVYNMAYSQLQQDGINFTEKDYLNNNGITY